MRWLANRVKAAVLWRKTSSIGSWKDWRDIKISMTFEILRLDSVFCSFGLLKGLSNKQACLINIICFSPKISQ